MFLKGHSHKALVDGAQVPVSSGTLLGVFNIAGYSRITGFVSAVSSATLTYKFGITSGTTFTSSGILCNSGPTIIDFVNYGKFIELSFSAAGSQAMPAVYIAGEPIR